MFAGGTGGDEHGVGMFAGGVVKMFTGGAAAGVISVGGVMFTGGEMCTDGGIVSGGPMFAGGSSQLGPTICALLDVRDVLTTVAACRRIWISRRFAAMRKPSC